MHKRMNANIESFYQKQALEQIEFEKFIKSEALKNEFIEGEYAESKIQSRIEEAESRLETYSWNL